MVVFFEVCFFMNLFLKKLEFLNAAVFLVLVEKNEKKNGKKSNGP